MLVVLLLAPGCRLSRKPRPILPPFRPPVQTESARKPAEPPEPAPAPEIPPAEQSEPMVMIPETLQRPQPPPPKPRRSASQPVQPPPAQPAPAPPPGPAPQLRPILTASQTQELERSINDRVSRAQGILKSLESRRLSSSQAALAGQIRTFVAQAEDARKMDLLRANNLAERAEVLATDLAQQMR
jgi:hypothetical protein